MNKKNSFAFSDREMFSVLRVWLLITVNIDHPVAPFYWFRRALRKTTKKATWGLWQLLQWFPIPFSNIVSYRFKKMISPFLNLSLISLFRLSYLDFLLILIFYLKSSTSFWKSIYKASSWSYFSKSTQTLINQIVWPTNLPHKFPHFSSQCLTMCKYCWVLAIVLL